MQNPKHTDELAFDDYMDRDALIIANMNGCVMMDTTKTNDFSLDHQNGYSASGTVFTSTNVKLQNAATPSSTNWNIPKFGAVTGPGRLEPAAAGGIYGKGFWLDSTIGLRFAVPKQSTSVDVYQKNWYVGLFIDCRDDAERQLLTFPDGTSIRLVVNNSIPTINYFQSNENSAGSVTIAQGIGN